MRSDYERAHHSIKEDDYPNPKSRMTDKLEVQFMHGEGAAGKLISSLIRFQGETQIGLTFTRKPCGRKGHLKYIFS